MIVSHKYKCIIVQPRKTAGTSLYELFKHLDPQVEEEFKKWNSPTPPYNHQTASQCRKLLGEDIWNSYYKFAFIRDPFSWVKSYYMHERKFHWDIKDSKYPFLAVTLRWNNMLQLKDNTITADNFLSLYTLMKWWYLPKGVAGQLSWFDEELDHIAILENIDEELVYLGNKLGFDPKLMPHINRSRSNEVRLDTDTHQLISILLKDDIEFYGKASLKKKL